MRNSRVNEELFSANHGLVPGALPSPAVKPLPFSYASSGFSSFTGSPSPLQQGVDCNMAYWQSMQKQQTNKELSESQHFHMPVQYPRFIGQTNNVPPRSQHSHMPVQYPRFNGQTKREPPGSQNSHMPEQYPRSIGQTNRDPPGSQHSHMPMQYPGFIGQTNKDPPVRQPSLMLVQYPGFVEPQLKSNMGPPRSYHSQLPQQHLGLTKDQLESLRLQQYMGTPWSNDSQLHLLKRGAITPASNESQPQRSFLHTPAIFSRNKPAAKDVQDVSEKPQSIPSSSPGNNLPRASYKGKEKVTPSSANLQRCTSVVNEPLGHGFPGNWGLLNTAYPIVLPKESYYPRLPLEFRQALEGCSPPSATIPDPYGETDEIFDIPFFRNTGSTNLSGPVGNSNGLSLAYNMKDLPSRKGKEVMNIKKRRREG